MEVGGATEHNRPTTQYERKGREGRGERGREEGSEGGGRGERGREREGKEGRGRAVGEGDLQHTVT